MTKKSIRCKHLHIVFIMSDKLWHFFRKYRYLLNGLFEAASTSILSWFYELNKSQNFKPGIMCTLHTFRRDLKWNPHILMLCSEGSAGNTEVFRIVRHINFKALRFRWQKLLLDYLSNNLPSSELSKFKKLKNEIYQEYKNDFYVYDFIKRLIKHIPDKNFKVVRYYGLYAKEHKQSKKLFKLLNSTQIRIKQQLQKWNLAIELSFGYNPTKCDCGGKLIFFELKVPKKLLSKSA